MNKTIKLTNGELLVKEYQSNIECFYNGECVSYSFDGCIEWTEKENINDFIENHLTDIVKLTKEDIIKVKEELFNIFYMHSADVFFKCLP